MPTPLTYPLTNEKVSQVDVDLFNIYCVEEVTYEDVIEKGVTIIDDELFIKQLFGDD